MARVFTLWTTPRTLTNSVKKCDWNVMKSNRDHYEMQPKMIRVQKHMAYPAIPSGIAEITKHADSS